MRLGGTNVRHWRRFVIVAVAAICASAVGSASLAAAANAGALSASLGGDPRGVPDPFGERSLDLFVSLHVVAYKRATVHAEGFADSPLELWVYEDPRGEGCSATPSGRPSRTRIVFAELPVEGAFVAERRLKMKNPGHHTFCAYLGPDEDTASNSLAVDRLVRRPLLVAGRARRTVAAALRRHGFANQVIENLEENCRRRSRSKFECRPSSAFPGYSLSGRGAVELKRRLSYRFLVTVRGRSFTLTDENEGGLPG
jgi:hypothetical protein